MVHFLCLRYGAGVRYLIVGGYAEMAYTEPRHTKDLDLSIKPSEPNAHTSAKGD